MVLLPMAVLLLTAACDEAAQTGSTPTPTTSATTTATTTTPKDLQPQHLSGRWEVVAEGNVNAFALVQKDGSIVFSTRARALGDFEGVITDGVVDAADKELTATLSEDEQKLTWSNGMVWGRIEKAKFGGRPWQR